MDERDIRREYREQRLKTLALADQIKEDRWHKPALPGDRSIHDVLAHLLAWDEWAVGVFEISTTRALPAVLVEAARDVDAYNARLVRRYRNLSRDDVLSALQATVDRVAASAAAVGGAAWADRPLPELTMEGETRVLTVGRILRILRRHEREHDDEIAAAFGISPHLEQFAEGEAGGQPG